LRQLDWCALSPYIFTTLADLGSRGILQHVQERQPAGLLLATKPKLGEAEPGESATDLAHLGTRLQETELNAELRRQVEEANRQLARYARELKDLADLERHKAQQIQIANQQLRNYARDLKVAVERERARSRELESAYLETVRRLTDASTFKDRETGAHIQRLSHYSRELALAAGGDALEAERLFAAAPMHDLGKIGIPDRVLHKEGPLDTDEWKIMKQHTIIGARLLEGSTSGLLELGRQIAIGHHERWDGTGYPFGLRGEEIPYAARIISICDSYDAIRSKRPYKLPVPHEATVSILLNGDGRTKPEHFDPVLLHIFSQIHERFAEIFALFQDDQSAD
jgi:HD-GYP domain-containing protein (c-di-GMP phosphodiesterase class II)